MTIVETRTPASEITALGLAAVGLAVSVYLTIEHYTSSTTLACPETSALNCAKVTSSAWSRVGPIPLALLGALYFTAMCALCTPAAWRMASIDRLRVVGAVGGVATALYLVWVELFRVEALCIWCTVVHVASLALLVCVLWRITGRSVDDA